MGIFVNFHCFPTFLHQFSGRKLAVSFNGACSLLWGCISHSVGIRTRHHANGFMTLLVMGGLVMQSSLDTMYRGDVRQQMYILGTWNIHLFMVVSIGCFQILILETTCFFNKHPFKIGCSEFQAHIYIYIYLFIDYTCCIQISASQCYCPSAYRSNSILTESQVICRIVW